MIIQRDDFVSKLISDLAHSGITLAADTVFALSQLPSSADVEISDAALDRAIEDYSDFIIREAKRHSGSTRVTPDILYRATSRFWVSTQALSDVQKYQIVSICPYCK